MFAEHGYDATTLEQVAAAAGFSKGAVYSNFAGKQELFLALVRERVEERMTAVRRVIAGPDGPSDQAERAGQAIAEMLERDPDWHRLFLEFWVRAVHEQELQLELAGQRRALRGLIAKTIEEQASQLGLELEVPSDQVAVIVLALSNGIAIEHLADPETVHPELFATALRVLVLGASSRPEGRT